MSPPPPPALLAIRASPTTGTTGTTQTTPIVPATTCDHQGMYVLPQILGDENKSLLRDASIFAVPNWNQSLVGMTACCGGSGSNNSHNSNSNSNNSNSNSNSGQGQVHVGGPEKCELWCLIPDEFLYDNNRTTDDDKTEGNDAPKKRNPGSTAAGLMKSCVKREGNITEEDFITMWQVKDAESSGASARFGLEGPGKGKVMSMKMVVAGVVGWGVVIGGLFA